MLAKDAPQEIIDAYSKATKMQRALALALGKGLPGGLAMIEAGYTKAQAKKCLPEVVKHPLVTKIASWYAGQALAKEADKVEMAVTKMADIALFDVKDTYNAAGKMLPVNEWPDHARKSFAGFDSQGLPKFWNPMDAAEKLFKVKGTYAAEKHEVDVTDKLADALRAARERATNR